MKIIFSTALLKASENTGSQIADSIASLTGEQRCVPTEGILHTIVKMERETQSSKHISVSHVGNEVTFEVSDVLIMRVLDMYSNVVHHVCALVMFARPMFSMLKREFKDIEEMVAERV